MAFAPWLAGLSLSARSSGVMGRHSLPAEDFPGEKMQATEHKMAMLQTNRWARFMAEVVSKFRRKTS
jgi:hypothetical protein